MANAHKEQLASRHARLDANIAAEMKRPVPDTAVVRRLKSKKFN